MRRLEKSGALVWVLLIGLCGLAACSDSAGSGEAGSVEVTGPVPNGERPNAFGAPVLDVNQFGYLEEEFFFEGNAIAYAPVRGADLGVDGRWSVEPSRSAPFKTRMLVLRPTSEAQFSGTVWVSWLNVTAGFEIVDVQSGYLRDGDALVYVSAQKVGLDGFPSAEANGLRAWDPVRYGSLHHPGDDFSYDIFTKAARLVGPRRGDLAVDPMGGLDVARVFASGISQSAFRLVSYVNGVQPLEKAFDAVLLVVSFGWSTRFETPPSDDADVDTSILGSTRIRDDLEIPVLLLTTETEAKSLHPVRQPDSDRFRTWEVAGAAHASAVGGIPQDTVQVFLRDGLQLPSGGGGGIQVPGNPNKVRWLPVMYSAREHLASWAQSGEDPPSFPLIDFAGDPPAIQRDEYGNARGGIRMPELEVPVATYGAGAVGGNLFGSTTPFPPDRLRDLYQSRAAYLGAYGEAVDRGVAASYFLERDADDIKAVAADDAAALFDE